MKRCIHCATEKDESAFNREHVLNQAFGTFENNLVLDCKCEDCNQFYGDTVDLKLARDTIEGFARFQVGTKKPAEFKTYGRNSTTRVEFREGPLRGAMGHFIRSPDGTDIGIAPNSYVGFARTPDEAFEWYPLDALPSKDELIAKGFRPGPLRMQTQGNAGIEEIRAALAAKGITGFEITSEEPPLTGRIRTEAVFTITHPEFRAVTKIALNYLAAVASPEVVLMPAFDVARRYARYDERPTPRIVHARVNPWHFEGPDGRLIRGHYLCVSALGEEIVAQVCLHTAIRYTVTLARGGVLFPGSFGHFFDPTTRHALAMASALPLEPSARQDEDAEQPKTNAEDEP